MKKRENTKTLHGKYSCTFRLNKKDRDAAYDFADRCGKGLSASALYVSSLQIVLEILNDPKKLDAVAPHSAELQRIAKLREDNAERYKQELEEPKSTPIGLNVKNQKLMKLIRTLAKNDPAALTVLNEIEAENEPKVKRIKDHRMKAAAKTAARDTGLVEA